MVDIFKRNFRQLMVNNRIVDMIGAIFDTRKHFPEKFELVQLWKIMDVLKDFIKVFIGLKKGVTIKVF